MGIIIQCTADKAVVFSIVILAIWYCFIAAARWGLTVHPLVSLYTCIKFDPLNLDSLLHAFTDEYGSFTWVIISPSLLDVLVNGGYPAWLCLFPDCIGGIADDFTGSLRL